MASNTPKSVNDVAANAGGLLIRLGLFVLMIVLPIAAIYSRRLVFSLMPVGGILIFLGATMTPGNSVMSDLRDNLMKPAALAAIWLLIWIGLSLVWTPFRQAGIEQFAKTAGTIALTFVVIAALPARSRTSNLNLMPIGAGLAAVAAVAIAFVNPSILPAMPDIELPTLERAAVGLVLFVWPALAALGVRERWASAGALAVAVAIAAISVWTPAALTGMAAGALVFSLAVTKPSRMALALGILFALIFLLAPALPFAAKILFAKMNGVPLGVSRAADSLAELVASDPLRLLTGYGYGAFNRALAGGFLPANMPGSVLVEIWFELGFLGALCAAGTALTGFIAAGRTDAHGAPFMLAGMTCTLVIAIWGLATLNLWWVTMICMTAIAYSSVLKGQLRDERPTTAGLVKSATQPAA